MSAQKLKPLATMQISRGGYVTSSWSPECAFRCLKLSLVQLCISKGSFPLQNSGHCAPRGIFGCYFALRDAARHLLEQARLSLSPTPPSGQTAPSTGQRISKSHKRPWFQVLCWDRQVKTPLFQCSGKKKTFSALSLSPHFYPQRCTNIFARCFYEQILLGTRRMARYSGGKPGLEKLPSSGKLNNVWAGKLWASKLYTKRFNRDAKKRKLVLWNFFNSHTRFNSLESEQQGFVQKFWNASIKYFVNTVLLCLHLSKLIGHK